jgi:hypothetical protein
MSHKAPKSHHTQRTHGPLPPRALAAGGEQGLAQGLPAKPISLHGPCAGRGPPTAPSGAPRYGSIRQILSSVCADRQGRPTAWSGRLSPACALALGLGRAHFSVRSVAPRQLGPALEMAHAGWRKQQRRVRVVVAVPGLATWARPHSSRAAGGPRSWFDAGGGRLTHFAIALARKAWCSCFAFGGRRM